MGLAGLGTGGQGRAGPTQPQRVHRVRYFKVKKTWMNEIHSVHLFNKCVHLFQALGALLCALDTIS